MKRFILILILLLAAFLRLYRLDSYPALNSDEAAIGYNAYSLIQTGKDEHGNTWPIHFQSFNDYKPGLYFYLVLPFVKLIGLNEWSVRLPGALVAVATVLVVYLLVCELGSYGLGVTGYNTQREARNSLTRELLPLVAAFFLAISPWHIHFSRGGWETNVATFFITCGLLFFLKSIKNPKFLVLSSSLFVLSLYTYHSARLIVPLLILGLLFIYRKEVKRNIKKLLVAAFVGIILLIPLGFDLTRGAVFSRAGGVGLFADAGPVNRANEQRGEHGNLESYYVKLVHNRIVNYSLAFLENWGDHFSGEFLFLTGDGIQRDKVPETGEMYLLDFLFIIFGLIAIIKDFTLNPKSYSLLLFWLVVAPVAAALTFQSPHALRAHNMVIPLTIISAFGFVGILRLVAKLRSLRVAGYALDSKLIHFTLYVLLATLIVWNFARYLHQYYLHMAKEYPFSSQYGVKELVSHINKEGNKYDHIVVTDNYDQPYILFLFYLGYPPDKFQSEHTLTPRDRFGFSTVESFDKYTFKHIVFDEDKLTFPGGLIIGTDGEIPDEANVVKDIYGTNGYKYFQIVAN